MCRSDEQRQSFPFGPHHLLLLRPAAVGLSGPRAAAAAVGLAGAVEGPVPLVAAERGDCLEGVHHCSTNGVSSKQFHNLFISIQDKWIHTFNTALSYQQ